MDDDTKARLILSALTLAGEPAAGEGDDTYNERLANTVARVAALCAPRSPLAVVIDDVLDPEAKRFVGTITKVVKEASSTRGVVYMDCNPSDRHPDGKETARTDRTDNPNGLRVAHLAQSLLGHRVLFTVKLEVMPNGDKVRIIKHVQDLGVAS
ncbi:hypothetical protein [Ferrimicrobium sp.]|uniref:hypothetical protein n=1 Tax=Ferrimicrobium sp. TaxID=2926050 RepID=UPI00261B22F1|nr:hypothetical protein [Ferrimicrobium sp.]